MKKETFYISTPIYYPSDKLHIGHSYCSVAADTMARYKRMRGYDVFYLTGTDEHGQKIQRIAEEKGITPKAYVDGIVAGIQELWKLLDIAYDKFIRTTDKEHEEIVQHIFQKLYDKGDIYKSEYEGLYCTPCEAFWTELQLADGKCPDCGREVEKTKEESYFFRISNYQDRLIRLLEENPEFLQPASRANEMLNNFLRPGLSDLAVSRTTFDWGVPVPFDEKHIIYVWIDALSNYITALGYSTDKDELFKKYWPCDIHLVGKEIVRFHSIIWPALLMALDIPLPKQVYGHGWLLLDGGKMSKSKGNVIDPVVLCDKYGVSAIRYFLLREMTFGSDGIFSNEALISRINSDLANDLGNLVSRTVSMAQKYFGGTLSGEMEFAEIDDEIIHFSTDCAKKAEEYLDGMNFSYALSEIWKIVSRLNKYIDETMPWILAKEESKKNRLKAVMKMLAEGLLKISILVRPFMPDTSEKIAQYMHKNATELTWEDIFNWDKETPVAVIENAEILFPRIDMKAELEELEKLSVKPAEEKEVSEGALLKPEGVIEIGINDFMKNDLRVAVVAECEPVKGSNKLLKLILDLGYEKRQVVSGIAKHYTPEEMLGKRVVIVSNLKPVKLCGEMSYGMILCASFGDMLKVVTVDDSVPAGSNVR